MQQTSYLRNYVLTNQQNFDNPWTFAPTNSNDSTVFYWFCRLWLMKTRSSWSCWSCWGSTRSGGVCWCSLTSRNTRTNWWRNWWRTPTPVCRCTAASTSTTGTAPSSTSRTAMSNYWWRRLLQPEDWMSSTLSWWSTTTVPTTTRTTSTDVGKDQTKGRSCGIPLFLSLSLSVKMKVIKSVKNICQLKSNWITLLYVKYIFCDENGSITQDCLLAGAPAEQATRASPSHL